MEDKLQLTRPKSRIMTGTGIVRETMVQWVSGKFVQTDNSSYYGYASVAMIVELPAVTM